MKSLNYTLSLSLALSLFACKKDKDDNPEPQGSSEMVVVATNFESVVGDDILTYHAIITDLDGNVLDFEEIAAGSTTVMSTGDPSIQYFDFHLVFSSTGQFNFKNGLTYHNVTGDTIELGGSLNNTVQPFVHSTLQVNGLPEFPENAVFDGGLDGVDALGVNFGSIQGQLHRTVFTPQKMFLSYHLPSEDKYRYYWNKEVLFESEIMVEHADLPQMSALKNIQMPNGMNTDFFYVYGKPNEADELFQLTTGQPGAVGEIPVFVPADFATDFHTNIVARDANFKYDSRFNEIPSQYTVPNLDFTLEGTANNGFKLLGDGFDFFAMEYSQPDLNLSWVVYGSMAADVDFKFPSFPDNISTVIGASPAQLTEPPTGPTMIDYEPNVSMKYLYPRYEPLPYTRKDQIRKL